MNKRQKEVLLKSIKDEEKALSIIAKNYTKSLAEIKRKIKELQAGELTQSKAYQIQFQLQLQRQLEGILDNLAENNYKTLEEYLQGCYIDGYIGNMYDIQGQGVPLVLPLNQYEMAYVTSYTGDHYKLSEKLYENINEMKKSVRDEMIRGFSTGMHYNDIARNISNATGKSMGRSKNIARTEGHRVTNTAKLDAMHDAKENGADVKKQWDSTLDSLTRPEHQALDGQVRELEENFEEGGYSADCPGHFGDPYMDCNCRCAMLQRARWAVDDESIYTKMNNESKELIQTTGYEDFKTKYLDNLQEKEEYSTLSVGDLKTFKKVTAYMKKKYDVIVDKSVTKLDFNATKQGLTGIENVMKEFPKAQSMLKNIGTDKTGMMCATYDGTINFNPGYFKKGNATIIEVMERESKTGLSPKNTGVVEVGGHEMGHILERTLIEKHGYEYTWEKIDAWEKAEEAKVVISEACKRAKKTPEGKGLINDQLIEQISLYAKENFSETLAEAVADYMANGTNASILSKEVWKILKRKLG